MARIEQLSLVNPQLDNLKSNTNVRITTRSTSIIATATNTTMSHMKWYSPNNDVQSKSLIWCTDLVCPRKQQWMFYTSNFICNNSSGKFTVVIFVSFRANLLVFIKHIYPWEIANSGCILLALHHMIFLQFHRRRLNFQCWSEVTGHFRYLDRLAQGGSLGSFWQAIFPYSWHYDDNLIVQNKFFSLCSFKSMTVYINGQRFNRKTWSTQKYSCNLAGGSSTIYDFTHSHVFLWPSGPFSK